MFLISAFELCLVLAVLAVAYVASARNYRGVRGVNRAWRAIGRRHRLAILLCGLAGFLASAGMSALRMPVPHVHDEFSNLLAADTFRQGRMTNPTHPMWEHFETVHVIQQPTYASKYPPAQGLILAAGQLIGGHPVVGVWLWVGLAGASMCWMLQGWVPGRWALLGGLMVALHPDLLRLWGHTYWGGDVGMAGGALLIGSLPRVTRRPTVWSGVAMALGLLILANNRPYEGFVLAVLVGLALFYRLIRRCLVPRRDIGFLLRVGVRALVPTTVVLGIGFAAMATYNIRVTGAATTMPYHVHEATYGATPLFLWKPLPPEPAYRHPVLRKFHIGWARAAYDQQRTLATVVQSKLSHIPSLWRFFLGPLLTVPLLLLPWTLRRRANWFPLSVLLAAAVAAAVIPWVQPRYFAPALPMLWLLVIEGLRQMCVVTFKQRNVGRLALQGLVVVFMLLFLGKSVLHVTRHSTVWSEERNKILQTLEQQPGQHLVVVRYGARHDTLQEWVYNDASIDAARVVWAREMSGAKNAELLAYFRDRRVWLLMPDESPPALIEHQ